MPVAGFEAGIAAAGEGAFSGDAYDEAEPAVAPASAADSLPPAGDEDGPPLEELEAQMRGEVVARDAGDATASSARRRAAAPAADEEEGDGKAAVLPEIDALVARLPPEVRETLDELFRARFIAVKKLPKRLLQPAVVKRAGGPAGSAS